jgi:hypothetical protein
MTISTVPELISTHSPDGCVAPGLHTEVTASGGATRTLTPGESGSVNLFDAATGVVYTLPTPVVGMEFEFAVTTSVTSNAHKIITGNASTFLLGAVTMASIATATVGGFSANGTTIRALSANGTTTGGLLGERYKVTAISATQWLITGMCIGSGTLATPFAIS